MKKQKNKIIILFIILSFLIVIVSIINIKLSSNNSTKEAEVVFLEFKAYKEDKYFILRDAYEELEHYSVHPEADLELYNSKENIHFVYFSHKKTDFKSFDDFSKYILKENKKIYGDRHSKFSEYEFLDYKAYSQSYRNTKDGVEIYLKTVIFKDDNTYNEIMIWSELDKSEIIKNDLLNLKIK